MGDIELVTLMTLANHNVTILVKEGERERERGGEGEREREATYNVVVGQCYQLYVTQVLPINKTSKSVWKTKVF